MDNQSKKTIFQTVILVIFGFAAMIAIAIFAMNKGTLKKNTGELAGNITVWGTIPYEAISSGFDQIMSQHDGLKITYVEKKAENYEYELVNALANSKGPDIYSITPEMIIRNRQRLLTIPFTSFPENTFKSTFASQSNLFVMPDGIIGFPMFIDPLMMYVNNDILTNSYIVDTPKTWDQLVSLNEQVTKKTPTGEIVQSLIGLGLYNNITHVNDIIALLLLQSGDPITIANQTTGTITTTLLQNGASVFTFYTGFSNPQSEFYAYNSGQQNDLENFIAGKSAFYLGFASELPAIRQRNPNLNFDIAMIPQVDTINNQVTYGNTFGWGISKTSLNVNLSVQLLQIMSDTTFVSNVLNGTWFAPARKDMLAILPLDDTVRTLIYKSAIISRGFWNPDSILLSKNLQENIDGINSGSITPDVGYSNWRAELGTLLETLQAYLEAERDANNN